MIWIKKVITANSGAAIRECHYMPNSVPPSWHNPVIIILLMKKIRLSSFMYLYQNYKSRLYTCIYAYPV